MTTPTSTSTPTEATSNPRPEPPKTGPKFNRLLHGLTSPSPVIPGESAEDWYEHRASMFDSLCPVGPLERELADRIANLLWRLRRVVRYETAATTAALDPTNAPPTDRTDARTATARHDRLPAPTSTAGWKSDLRSALGTLEHCRAAAATLRRLDGRPDTDRLRGSATGRMIELVCRGFCRIDMADPTLTDRLGLPKGPALGRWKKWTVGLVRAVFGRIGTRLDWTEDEVRVEIGRWLEREIAGAREWVDRAEQGLAKAEAADRAWDAQVLIDEVTTKVARYEAHLSRQLKTAYQMFRQMQADRLSDGLGSVGGWGLRNLMRGRDGGFSGGGSDGLPEIVVVPRRSTNAAAAPAEPGPAEEPVAPAGGSEVVSTDQPPRAEAEPDGGPGAVSTDQAPKAEVEPAGEPAVPLRPAGPAGVSTDQAPKTEVEPVCEPVVPLPPVDPVEISTDQDATEGRMDPTGGEWVDVTGPVAVAVTS